MKTQQFPQAQEIEKWLVEHLSELLGITAAEIDRTMSFERYGLDSSAVISVTESLGDYVGRTLQPTLLNDFPNIVALAEHLAPSAN
jgi:acyl carrier protein